MSYQYVKFLEIPLPLYDHEQAHDPMLSEPTLLDSVGGSYDWRGSNRQAGRKQIISGKGKYFGEITYLVDQSGNQIVDESGNSIITGNAQQTLAAEVRALMEKKGLRGPLWRNRLADSVLQWKTARLLQVNWPRKVEDHAIIAEVSYQFETQMEFWHAATPTISDDNATDGVPLILLVSNSGMTVEDSIISIARSSGTITSISITGVGIDITWAGSLGASDELVIDCGLQTIRKNDTDAYSGFALGVSHTAAGWMPLLPGDNLITVTVTGGNAAVENSHYNQYV